MIDIPKHKQLILFDGTCNLCNSTVLYVIKHDKNNTFIFASLQSSVGASIMSKFNIDPKQTDSILLYIPKKGIYKKSTAAIKIALKLGFPRYLLGIFLILPPFIRDLVYNYIAKNRYKWFGKTEQCALPSPHLTHKFIE